MNTRILIILSLLVGIGAVLHAVVPPVLFGVKPDMLLAMMFLGILLFPKIKYVAILSIATGVVSALTTTAPGDKLLI
ncbi:putative tryptophan transport protein [Virgibacillus salexigens]|uniref:Putative tryptophan transport protein n=1 Tax=Virgibacillus massiliensis TaxID=1462526 RepID=A0A024QER6_9BACI|nr:putative tryptophan transport protein [Virgibacillus massiliensis]